VSGELSVESIKEFWLPYCGRVVSTMLGMMSVRCSYPGSQKGPGAPGLFEDQLCLRASASASQPRRSFSAGMLDM